MIGLRLRYCITGSNGFIGTHLVSLLKNDSNNTIVPAGRFRDKKMGSIELGNSGEIDPSLFAEIDTIIHLAGPAHAKIDDVKVYKQGILNYTKRIGQAARKAEVKNFIFASTINVYGESFSRGAVDESTLCKPTSLYGIYKLKAEDFLLEHLGRKKVWILRIPPVYGIGAKGSLKLIFKAASAGCPFPQMDHAGLQSFISIQNLAKIIQRISQNKLDQQGILIPEEEDPVTILNFYKQVYFEFHKKKPHLLPLPSFVQNFAKKIGVVSRSCQSFRSQTLYRDIMISADLYSRQMAINQICQHIKHPKKISHRNLQEAR